MQSISERIKFIKSIFGTYSLSNDGNNVAVRCPGCKSTGQKKKFSINLKTWQCHCWVCGIKGKDLSPILKKFFNKSDLDLYLKNFLNQASNSSNFEDDPIEVPKLPEGFALLADNIKSLDPDLRSCLSYLYSRGITQRDLWYFKLGTCSTGRHRRRIIFPSFDSFGNLNYYSSRSIDSNKIKYINAKFDKRDIIFNEINIDWSSELTLTEGPFDLIKCDDNSSCLLGSNIGEKYFLFKKIVANSTPIVLALDSDMGKKSLKIAKLLSSYGCDVKIMSLGEKSDVGEMTKNEFLKHKREAMPYDRNHHMKKMIGSLRSGSII